ncbi:MAG: hypothetical protein O3B04_10100 [Chloroflexi bacterium]|nr:hypothetical protein [Chloroflexota bacterium]
MTALTAIAVIALVILLFAPNVAGAVIARKAWKRNGWPEARLAFRMFVAGPVIVIASGLIIPLIGWTAGNTAVNDLVWLVSLVAVTAQGIVTLSIAVALYRLARRSAHRTSAGRGGNNPVLVSPDYSGEPVA